jgi:DNA polymerase-3 subunit epsilon
MEAVTALSQIVYIDPPEIGRSIVLDTETTGLKPEDGHRIIEVGLVELNNRIPTGNVWHGYINPEYPICPNAQKIHGLSNDFLKQFSPFHSCAKDIIDFLDGSPLVIHNAIFDMKFLWYEYNRLCPINSLKIVQHQVVDTLILARHMFPRQSNTLDALCKRFRIDTSHRQQHGALLDAKLLAGVYLEMTGGSQKKMFHEEGVRESKTPSLYGERVSPLIKKSLSRAPRTFGLSFQEKYNHNKLCEKLGQKPWG